MASIGYATTTEQLAMVLLQLEVAFDRMNKLLLQPDGYTPIDHAYPPMDDAAKLRKVQERLGHESLLEYRTRIKEAITGGWRFGQLKADFTRMIALEVQPLHVQQQQLKQAAGGGSGSGSSAASASASVGPGGHQHQRTALPRY